MSMKCERVALQHRDEMTDFSAFLRNEKAKSYLEIGSKHGGSLWYYGNILPRGSRLVAVDLPHGDQSFKETLPNLKECVAALKKRLYDVHLIIGDSTSPEVIEQVRALGPFDVGFIDGNHTLPFVRKDLESYGPMCRILAFHDISFYRPPGQEPKDFGKIQVEVPIFWKEIKDNYRHQEIRRDKNDNGIGIIWTS